MKSDVDKWVKIQYTKRYCDSHGQLDEVLNLDKMVLKLIKMRPDIAAAITNSVQR